MSRQEIKGPDRLRGEVIRQIYKLNIDTRLQHTYSQTCYEAKEITTNCVPARITYVILCHKNTHSPLRKAKVLGRNNLFIDTSGIMFYSFRRR